MPYPKCTLTVSLILLLSFSARAQQLTPSTLSPTLPDNLVVVWVANGDLFVRHGNQTAVQLTTGQNLLVPFLSPDGSRVAFVSGGETGLARSLNVMNTDGGNASILFTADENLLVNQIGWLDDTTLFFNTAQHTTLGHHWQDDLWQVKPGSGEAVMLFPPGKGGMFTSSPDRQYVALVSPGVYGEQDGTIRIVNVETGDIENTMSFAAVSTGSEYRFYPAVYWEADSRALRSAVPDKDLIYHEMDVPPAALWRLGADTPAEEIGSVSASLFGLPVWSDDGAYVAYLRRVGELADNQFELWLAAGNGENPAIYVKAEAALSGVPIWIPDSHQFIYPQGNPGEYWLGSPAMQPRELPGSLMNPKVVGDNAIGYVSMSGNTFELRYMSLDSLASVLVASGGGTIPVFDAVLTQGS